jgi:hypothetical protein
MDDQPKGSSIVLPSAQPPEDGSPRSSRRSLLAALVGGLAGLLGGSLARPQAAEAAAGDPLIIGQANNAGSSQTILNSAATGASFTLKTTNTATNSTGIFGWTSQTGSNTTRGVYGKADGANSDGVQGVNSAATNGTGAGVRAIGNNNHGLVATTSNTSANAVRAIHQATQTGFFAAVLGQAINPDGVGVYGANLDASLVGVGVLGYALYPGFGMYAFGDLGVTADAYVYGNLYVSGSVSKGGGTFKIDHPLDPANKYLVHSFVESDEMKTVYDGVAHLDGAGQATVTMPAWFAALNRDVRIQLTPVGGAMPDLHVGSLPEDGTFTIAGGTPGGTVCWQVTGVRKDAWARAHPIRVEEAKGPTERGRYLHPVELGKPTSLAVEPGGRQRPAALQGRVPPLSQPGDGGPDR